MSQAATDRNLLFGILAVQLDFVARDTLIVAMNAWAVAKHKSLGQIFEEQGSLAAERRALLDALVAEHLRQHGDDAGKSLAALQAPGAMRDHLRYITDPDVRASLVGASDAYVTRTPSVTPSVGESTSNGVRFRILRPHAKGGLGQVFVAEDVELHREVALKEIQERHADNSSSRSRFVLEAEVTGNLEHPGIVPVYGMGQYADGRPFYAMRFIRGDSMKQAIERFHKPGSTNNAVGERSVAFRQLLARFVTVCDVIAYAHSRGVLHRDLKPDNIMLGKFGETMVVDWGLAKPLGELQASKECDEAPLRPVAASVSSETLVGSTLGTPQYMSPEQAAGQLKRIFATSDIYSLGATLYAILTGQPPFTDADTGTVLRQVQQGDFPRPRQVQRHVPAALEAVCLKAMALRPEDRYPSTRALADDIEHWLADEPILAHREHWVKRLRRWARRHQVLVSASVLLFLAALSAGVFLDRERIHAERMEVERVQTLLHASAESAPDALDALAPMRDRVAPLLRAKLAEPGLSDRVRARVALGLLPLDPSMVDYLRDRMLQDSDPREVLLVRNQLAPFRDQVVPGLWSIALDPMAKRSQCLRALVALAHFDPENSRWPVAAEHGVPALLDEWHFPSWGEALYPVRSAFQEPLTRVFRASADADDCVASALILAEFDADRPNLLVDLLLDADPKQHAILWPKVKDRAVEASSFLLAELDRQPPGDFFAPESERMARRQAKAALALLNLGQPERTWQLLRHTPDPRVRSHLIPLFEPLRTDVGVLVARWGRETDSSARRALLFALGTYDQMSPEERERVAALLLDLYKTDPDPGLHSAIDWLVLFRLRMKDRIIAADKALAGKPPGDRLWFVTRQLNTLAIVPHPVEFDMGSSAQEPGRNDDEVLHRVRIPRGFAIGTKQITVGQFHHFLLANPAEKFESDSSSSSDVHGPIVRVDWYSAARYCRWLSEQEGIPEDQMCFPPLPRIKPGMMLPADYLRRTGYRLPTEAEWEYASRAGAVTSRFYGNDPALLPSYAWFRGIGKSQTDGVARRMPNDLGLFDALGNVREWCMDRYADYPLDKLTQDTEGPLQVADTESRVLRGSSFLDLEATVRCAVRNRQVPSARISRDGFRIARTMPAK
ncbi:MAG: SUMF1/EgtB/PvdO family nonheme iron enzyme [Gemmataceae bacterium]|nr:SUMF1/EgtB/PvdO family nonheme iron enzyme [Gemmataceae bacterium]